MRPATVVFDTASGFMELGKAQQYGEITENSFSKGEWGLKWNNLMGSFSSVCRLGQRIAAQGTHFIMTGHTVPNYLFMGTDPDTKMAMKKLVGFKVDIPGSGAEDILRPFDEAYHLVAVANDGGAMAPRKLFTGPHLYEGYPFAAKSRKGIRGPIMNPTYEGLIKALPAGRAEPRSWLIVGLAGVGKTMLSSTWPGSKLWLDMEGGCADYAKEGDVVVQPKDVGEVIKWLLKVEKGQPLAAIAA